MEHSVRGYLQRQPTQLLEIALQHLEREELAEEHNAVVGIIREILEQRKAQISLRTDTAP